MIIVMIKVEKLFYLEKKKRRSNQKKGSEPLHSFYLGHRELMRQLCELSRRT